VSFVACTIVSKNYLPFARVWARSLAAQHPEAQLFVLLVDRVDGRFDPAAEPFELVEVEALGNVPDFQAFAFKYTVLELNTAVKPFFLEHLFARTGTRKLIYFDPDILVFQPLTELLALLDQHAYVLTPHLTAPIEDDRHPSELAILQSGSYNLGFVALSRCEAVDHLVRWWQERMTEHCVVDLERGLFVDQKWMDLAPGLFAGAFVLRRPGYNMAYWNLHERRLAGEATAPTVNGEPLVFFHYSGFDPRNLSRISKHQNRFTLGDLPELKALFQLYRDRLLEAGFQEARGWPYAFAQLDNGVAIPDAARALFYSLFEGRRRFGDPFATAAEGSFWAWLRGPAKASEPGQAYLSRLLDHLWRERVDLLQAFPDAAGRDLPRFADWLWEGGAREHGLDEVFLEPLAPLAARPAAAPAAAAAQVRRTARQLWTSDLARQAKFHAKRLLGEERTKALKRRLLGGAPGEPPEVEGAQAHFAISRFGVNVTGYLTTESGVGEAGRTVVRTLRHAGIPVSLQNLELGVVSRREDRSFEGFSAAADYDLNLFFVNADQAGVVYEHLGRERFRGKFNIGFWNWELAEFPAAWYPSFRYFHEIWTGTRFSQGAIATASSVPVVRIPYPVEVDAALAPDRARFGLDPDAFVFLFAFDFLSYLERKNPFATLAAFQRAFRPDEKAVLVLKTVNADWNQEGAAHMREAARGWPVVFVDEYLSKREVAQLMATADCYVSLHRGEGFGLTLAEAMALGKPVVATGYSGNLDFMTPTNSLPVGYRLVEITEGAGPYAQGFRWADPDVEHAAELMRRLYEDRALAARIGEQARATMRAEYGLDAAAAVVRQRLGRILELVNGPKGERFGL
jgi:glycosyltransferase involved in cell wall biosynthesis